MDFAINNDQDTQNLILIIHSFIEIDGQDVENNLNRVLDVDGPYEAFAKAMLKAKNI